MNWTINYFSRKNYEIAHFTRICATNVTSALPGKLLSVTQRENLNYTDLARKMINGILNGLEKGMNNYRTAVYFCGSPFSSLEKNLLRK